MSCTCSWRRFDRAVLLLRNPVDTLLSYLQYIKTRDHASKLSRREFRQRWNREQFERYVYRYICQSVCQSVCV